jgi:DUF4097 and DUF4098 domain-containing protein YvlB
MRRLATLTLTLLVATAAHAATDQIKRGFNVAPGGTLRLEAEFGDVTIVTGGTGVAIEINREASGRRGEEIMREHKITIRQEGNDVVIDSDFDDRDWDNWFSRYEVEWNIRIPSRYNVDVTTSGGGIELADIGGTVEAKTSGGGIDTGHLDGPATLKTSGGSIRVKSARGNVVAHTSGGGITIGDATGPVEAKTSGGSITLARVEGDVVARTSGGGIRIEDATGSINASTSGGSIHASMSRQPRGDSKLSTSGGGVTLAVAPNLAVELDARASGGGVRSDVPVTVQGTQDEDTLQGRINGGGPQLVLRTSGGGIRIKSL